MERVSKELREYIVQNIFPLYKKNDAGHGLEHIKYVIGRSLKFASTVPDINYDMVYTIGAFHDVGHHIDAKNHEKVSAEILLNDEGLRNFFTEEQIKIMSEAVYDHRASLEYEPRSIYGKIVSSADRNTTVEMPFLRTYTYRIYNSPQLSLDEIVEESRLHVINKFGRDGYATERMYFEDLDYKRFLETIDELARDKDKFREKYYELNGINDVESNMVFLFDEIRKSHPELPLDTILHYVYIKLNTDKSFEEIKKRLMDLKGMSDVGSSKILRKERREDNL